MTGRLVAMTIDYSFRDLPSDWSFRPLTDPRLAGQVMDLVVQHAERQAPGLAFLLARPDATLAQPVVAHNVWWTGVAELTHGLHSITSRLAEYDVGGGLVLGIIKARGLLDDRDRVVHTQAMGVCRELGLELHHTFLVTQSRISHLPVAQGIQAQGIQGAA